MTEFPRRQIRRTGLRVTELGLGCAKLGGSQITVAPCQGVPAAVRWRSAQFKE
jgi:aryl-alcohol dehydrogenase-like predicted oxidoreductase